MDVAAARGPGAPAAAVTQPQQQDQAPAPAARPDPARTAQRPAADLPDLKFTLESADIQARFAIHEATNRVMITMYHRQTGEVVREIPPKKLLDMLAAFGRSGMIVDQRR